MIRGTCLLRVVLGSGTYDASSKPDNNPGAKYAAIRLKLNETERDRRRD